LKLNANFNIAKIKEKTIYSDSEELIIGILAHFIFHILKWR